MSKYIFNNTSYSYTKAELAEVIKNKIAAIQMKRPNIPFIIESQLLYFPSKGKLKYRIKITNESNRITIWIEDKQIKSQWGTEVIDDITKCGPVGISLDTVLKCLDKAISIQVNPYDKPFKVKDDDPPYIDIEESSNEIKLILSISISGFSRVIYSFPINQLVVDKVDVLNSQLLDSVDVVGELQKEFNDLKGELIKIKPNFLNLSSHSNTQGSNIISWNEINGKRFIPDTHYHISEDNSTVTVLLPGVYQINIRVPHNHTANGSYLALLNHNEEIARSYESSNSGHQITSHIHQVFTFTEPAELTVRYTNGNNTTYGSESLALGNVFNIISFYL